MKFKQIILFLMLLITFRVSGQEIVVARFSVEAGSIKQGSTPVSVSLDGLDYNTDKGALRLFELKGKTRTEVACQLEAGNSPRLWWIAGGQTPANVTRKYLLLKDSNS